jgi:type IV pilus assembly protein PilC
MMGGGVPITEAFDTIAQDVGNPYFEYIITEMSSDIKSGQTLSQSVAKYPNVFNTMFNAMILAGEQSGNLPEVFEKLAHYYIKRDEIRRRVRSALAYPLFVVGFVIVIIAIMATFVIPKFTEMFSMFGDKPLPAFTVGFLAVYNGMKDNFLLVSGITAAVVTVLVYYGRTKTGHRQYSRLALRFPLMKGIIKNAFVSTYCTTMATMLTSGVSILETLDILKQMTGNDVIKKTVTDTSRRITEGENICDAMSSTNFYPNLLLKMVDIGEKAGTLSSILDKTSDYFQKKLDEAISTMTAMLEPIMIVVVGAIVLVVVLALYLPIFTMSDI